MAQSNDAPWENYRQPASGDSAGPWSNYAPNPELGLAKPKSRNPLAVLNDTAIEAANAAAGGVSAAANFVKPGNDVSGWIDKNIIQAGEAAQSDVVKASKQQFRQEVQDADGVGGELAAVGKYVAQNPLLAAAQAAGSFAGPGLAVKGAGLAARAGGLAGKAVETAGRAGGVAAGAALAGGDAAGTAYDLAKHGGATEDQAVSAARGASVLPAVVGGAGGAFGAERLLAGGKGFAGGAAARAVKTGASEAAQEAVEEGVTQYEGQRAAMPFDPSIDPSKGVAAAAGMGAALGGVTGAGTSLLTGGHTSGQQPQQGEQQAPAEEAAMQAPLLLGNQMPERLISFPDRSVGRVGEVESYLANLPEDQREEARAKIMGQSIREVNDPAAQQARRWWENYGDGAPQAPGPDYLAEVQAAVRSGTQFSTQQTVDTVRDAMEDAWLAQNVGADPAGAPAPGAGLQAADAMGVQLQGQFQQASEDAGIAAVDARVRTGRILSGLQNLLDGGAENSAQVLGGLNEGLARINEQPLDASETQRVRRMVDAYMGFRGVGEPAPLPADRAPAVDPFADNAAMEALIPQRPLQRPSERMGINPADGPLSRGAAMAVDAGFDATQQAALQAQEIANAQGAQAQAAAVAAPAAISPTGPGALEAAGPGPLTQTTGATFAPQADQAQQAGAQPPQTTGAPGAPAAGAAAAQEGLTNASTTTFNDGAQGGPAPGSQGQAQAAAARPANWRSSSLPAGRVARSLGIDPKGKRLAQILAEVDAADAARAGQQQAARALNEESPAAQWVDASARAAGPDLTSLRSAGDAASVEQAAAAQFSRNMPEELARTLRRLRPPPAAATNSSVRQAVNQLVGGMGVLPNSLGRIVVTTSDDIRANWEPLIGPVAMGAEGGGKAQGFYDPNTKTVFVISDHIVAGDELGVVAHELMHKHGPAVLGEEGWNQLHGAIGGWTLAPEGSLERQVYNEAAARVRDSQPATGDTQAYSSQELLPYAVQVALEMGVRPSPLAKPGTVARWLDQVRKALRQVWVKIAGSRADFNSQDLVNLAFGIAQRENPALAGGLDGVIAGMEGEIRAVIEAARGPGHAPQKAVLGQVSDWLAREVVRVGLDVAGFSHVLDGSAVRHMIKNHFDGGGERARGQVPLTDQDLMRLPEIVSSPDRVVLGTTNRLGKQQIVYVKKMEDGSVLYLEEARTGRRELAAVSARKYPATMNVETVVSTLHPNAQGDGGNGLIVLTPPEAGKNGGDGLQFSRTAPAAPTASDYTAEQARAAEHAFGVQVKQTWAERAQAMRQNFGTRLRQGLVDQFAPIKEISEKAYILARLSKGSDGAVEAALLYGKPYLRDGVADVDIKDGGFANVLASLKGEHDRFFQWVAAQRAQRLKAEGKENLLTDRDITALRSLDAGRMADGTARMPLYAAALRELNAFNEASLKVARDSGLIDQAAYDLMKDQPYVPFYRLMEEDGGMRGPRFSSGLVNQQAWKKLKGGTQQLNADLLQNTLMNWSHLYAAAARNRASLETMDAAEKLGVAYQVPADTKGAVKVMREGVAEHWAVEDPYLVDAISAMSYTPGGIVKAMAPFKRLLTFGVTVNPTFKIRNLIRDSLSAIAQSDLSYNPLENVAKGWKATDKNSQTYASMLASGGIIKFGTQENTNQLRGKIERLGGTMLDKQGFDKLKGQMRSLWEVYEEFGDRTENVNRTALYERLRAKGLSHAEASFQARDLMDFSMSGKWETVRFLAQTVPFLNARLQGLYKLGRAAGEDPRRFAAMAGAVSMASLGLLAAYADDDDWKKREDFDRDNLWWFKIGDKAFRIPKPFEVGAIGTVAERTAELMMSEEMTGKRFGQRISDMVFNTFAMDPTPQAIKPFLDVYANKDSFSGRAIEGMADERLRPQDRYNERTSEVARLLGSWGLPDPVRLAKSEYSGLSPKQVDFLLRGYFGWLATVSTTATDTIARPMLDRGERPSMRLRDTFLAGNFVEELPTGSSRYVTTMYEQAKGVEQAWASHQAAIKSGDIELARSIQEEEGPKLRNRMAINAAKQQMAELGQHAKKIEGDRLMTGEIKHERLTQIEQQRNAIAQRVAQLTD
ncbi:LPD38 domain-containing protein [Delftia acidovorans]|uniref:LPD38 domain-containing protein n=1 Tax=Delftia acidovorans TaxID=80866 RepID=UPI001E2D3E56|nr:LPD38 domain-containing protein [Delftia acidovorans]